MDERGEKGGNMYSLRDARRRHVIAWFVSSVYSCGNEYH